MISPTLNRRTLVSAAAAAWIAPAVAGAAPAPFRLNVGEPLVRFDRLTPGVRTYLRSIQRGDQTIAVDVWRRETRLERVDGVERLRILQRWDGADQPAFLMERDSLFEKGTFRPLTHQRITSREGVRVVEAFRFEDAGLHGLEGVADNQQAAFAVVFDEPMFNFETDLEFLQTLPWEAGWSVSIPFYHPGGGAPARYVWSVAGEARLSGPDGSAIECWIVETDYNAPEKPRARFWLSKRTQQFIKLEMPAADGTVNRKTLLSLEPA